MDKELLEILNEALGDLLNDDKNKVINKMQKEINKAFKEKASISIEKFEDGRTETHIEGSTLGILIALAGLEKSVLEKLDVPREVWGLIKRTVGTKEVK